LYGLFNDLSRIHVQFHGQIQPAFNGSGIGVPGLLLPVCSVVL
jgi:hypothetical protein